MKRTRIRNFSRTMLALMLIFSLVAGVVPAHTQAVVSAPEVGGALSDEQVSTVWEQFNSRGARGLVGFTGENELPDGDEKVSVIVLFNHQPAVTEQMIQATVFDSYLSLSSAEALVAKEHADFRSDLSRMFPGRAVAYTVTAEYWTALNGVAITLPASRVAELAELDSVFAVYPDETVYAGPLTPVDDIMEAYGDNSGNSEGRNIMNAGVLHTEGYQGGGISVCVIDTGVDYNHPDLQDAFAADNPAGTTNESDRIDGIFYGRNFVNTSASYPQYPNNADNDPMETTYAKWQTTNYAESSDRGDFYTAHGTHVSGIIAGRGVSSGVSTLGVAPEATLFVYRALGPYGTGENSSTLAAIEMTDTDQPDVVNMSMGASGGTATSLTSMAVNNISLKNPDMLFVIAAGNNGDAGEGLNANSFSIGTPATSQLALTVANGTVASTDTIVTAGAYPTPDPGSGFGSMDFQPYFLNTETTIRTEKVPIPGLGDWDATSIDSPGLAKNLIWKPYPDFGIELPAYGYDIVTLPKLIENPNNPNSEFGTGYREEFEEAVKPYKTETLGGKIIVVSRGNVFLETMELAKEFGAGAVLLITKPGDTLDRLTFAGAEDDYIPFFVAKHAYSPTAQSTFADTINYIVDNGGQLELIGLRNSPRAATIQYTSSRGPVRGSYDIKPDITAHGTDVLSTVPNFPNYTSEEAYADGDYTNAQKRFTGTSMACPQMAGAAALLKNYSEETTGEKWTALEIKARLMNTANRSAITGKSVYEQGAGYANVNAAAKANAFVTVELTAYSYTTTDGTSVIEENQAESASFSFGFLDVETLEAGETAGEHDFTKTLTATVSNTSDSEKTYTITSAFNTSGLNVRSAADRTNLGLTVTFDKTSITVPANETATFTATVDVPESATPISASLEGSYEGYITLSGGGGTYNLPFAVYASKTSPPLEGYFLNRPVISSGENAQNTLSTTSDLYINAQAIAALQFYIANDSFDPAMPNEGDLIGLPQTPMTYTDLMSLGTWVHYPALLTAQYYEYVEGEYVLSTLASGDYQFVIVAQTEDGELYFYAMDFCVDNDAPELTVPQISHGGYNSIFVESGDTAVTLTGTVYDIGTEQMADRGVAFEIWEDGDVLERIPDQSYSLLVAELDGVFYRADINDPATGEFSVTLPIDALQLPAKVTLYAIDGFSITTVGVSKLSTYKLPQSTDFCPEGFSYTFTAGGENYGWLGSNMSVADVYIELEQPGMILSESSVTMFVNESIEVEALFNTQAQALDDEVVSAVADNDSNVRVSFSGNTITVEVINPGKSTVTVRSKNGLEQTIHIVTYINQVNAGVPTDGYFYYGATKHATGLALTEVEVELIGGGTQTVEAMRPTYEAEKTPMLWQAMGEEKTDGVGDGYLSLLSKYAVDASNYSVRYAGYIGNPNNGDTWTIRNLLNGGIHYKLVDFFTFVQRNADASSLLLNGFSDSERGVMPETDNPYQSGATTTVAHEYARGDKLYLPWFLTENEVNADVAVYWTAGVDSSESNALISGKPISEITEEDEAILATTFRNGTPTGYWLETASTTLTGVAVNRSGEDDPILPTAHPGDYHGVRPGMKLDMNAVVYAYEITPNGGVGKIRADDKYPIVDESIAHYKLTVLSADNGEAIGSIDGLPSSAALDSGETIRLSGYTASGSFDRYAYKIVDDSGNIVAYGEAAYDVYGLTLNTGGLGSGSYRAYIWPQENNEINSNEAGVVSVLNLTVSSAGRLPPADKKDDDKPASDVVAHQAYISGYPDGTFRADDNVTRVEAASMLFKLLEETAAPGEGFRDVASDAWYYEAIMALAGAGVINGYVDGTFRPNNPVSRVEFVAMVIRLAGATGTGDVAFSDVAADHWAYDYIATAVGKGYILGYPDGTFGPEGLITRAEAVAIIGRVLGCDYRGEGKQFPDVLSTHWAYYDILAGATAHVHTP